MPNLCRRHLSGFSTDLIFNDVICWGPDNSDCDVMDESTVLKLYLDYGAAFCFYSGKNREKGEKAKDCEIERLKI